MCVRASVSMCGHLSVLVYCIHACMRVCVCVSVCKRKLPAGSDVMLMLVLWGKQRGGRTPDCCSHCETGTHTQFMSAKI